MSRKDWIRAFQHFPIGGIAAWATSQDVALGLGLLGSAFIYEAFNDWRKGDASYKDVLGIVQGFGIVGVILIIGGQAR